jgi:hypothetical protein
LFGKEDEDDILMGPSLEEILGSTDRMLATFSDFEDFELIDASESDSEMDESEQRRRLLSDVSCNLKFSSYELVVKLCLLLTIFH